MLDSSQRTPSCANHSTSPTAKQRNRSTPSDRLSLVFRASHVLHRKHTLFILKPDTLLRGQCQGYRLFREFKSGDRGDRSVLQPLPTSPGNPPEYSRGDLRPVKRTGKINAFPILNALNQDDRRAATLTGLGETGPRFPVSTGRGLAAFASRYAKF